MDYLQRLRRRPPLLLFGLTLSLSLLAAACGGAEEVVNADAAEVSTGQAAGQSTESAEPVESADASDESGSAEDNVAGQAEPAEEASHSFPDLSTTNIADGSTINLAAELAGGDTAVLLWFFAPH